MLGSDKITISNVIVFVTRALWLLAPLVLIHPQAIQAGPLDVPDQVVGSFLIAGWLTVTWALFWSKPVSLTVIRICVPWVGLVGLLSVNRSPLAYLYISICVVLALTPFVSAACAAGAAYGSEKRYPLKVPPAVAFVWGPWAVIVTGFFPVSAIVLASSGLWIPSLVCIVVATIPIPRLVRSVHSLSKRWLVSVPAGWVIVDPMTLGASLHIPFGKLESIRPGSPTTESLDLTLGAHKGALLITLNEPVVVDTRSGKNDVAQLTARSVAIAPALRVDLTHDANSAADDDIVFVQDD